MSVSVTGLRQTDTWLSLVARKRTSAPVGRAGLELETGELRHQVALGRPEVAEVSDPVADASRPRRGGSGATRTAGRPGRRCRRPGAPRRGSSGPPPAPAASRWMGGTQRSMTKRPPGRRWCAALRKHCTCSACVRRLEMLFQTRKTRENVPAPATTVVAMSPTTTGSWSSSTLRRSRATIGSDSSMPVTGTPRSAQRDGDAAGPDGELQRRSALGQALEEVDRRAQDLGSEHRRRVGVVASPRSPRPTPRCSSRRARFQQGRRSCNDISRAHVCSRTRQRLQTEVVVTSRA